jgi:hypothetical protein
VSAVSARYVHWAAFDARPSASELDKLSALLAYGEAGPQRGRQASAWW